jgi:fructose-1,6-bisphosphatase I
MAYLLAAVGGNSSNGDTSILALQTTELHQKTPVFLGESALITEMEKAKKGFGLGV